MTEVNALRALKYYNMITYKYMNFEIISEKFISYYSPECPNVFHWNAAFHYDLDLKIDIAEIKKIYDFYNKKNCDGNLLSYSNKYNEFSVFHGSFFYLNKDLKKFDDINENHAPLKLIQIDDMDNFTKQVDHIFRIGEMGRQSLSKILNRASRYYYHRSYFSYYEGNLCGTITIIQCDPDNYFIFNLGVLEEFKNLNLLGRIVEQIYALHKDANIFTIEDYNDVLSKKVLPELGFKNLGDFHLLNVKKLYEFLEKKEL